MIYETRITAVIVAPEGEPTFSEYATTVSINDEAGGEFVVVSQEGTDDFGKIAIDRDYWPALRLAIDSMIEKCRDNGTKEEA